MSFKEKADNSIIQECENFISNYSNQKLGYFIFKEALALSAKLRESLIASHKDFDDAIKKELENMPHPTEDIKMDMFIYKFNQKEIRLELDVHAHNILEELEKIQRQNRQ